MKMNPFKYYYHSFYYKSCKRQLIQILNRIYLLQIYWHNIWIKWQNNIYNICYGKYVFLVSLYFVYLNNFLRFHFTSKYVRFMLYTYLSVVMNIYQKFIFTVTYIIYGFIPSTVYSTGTAFFADLPFAIWFIYYFSINLVDIQKYTWQYPIEHPSWILLFPPLEYPCLAWLTDLQDE